MAWRGKCAAKGATIAISKKHFNILDWYLILQSVHHSLSALSLQESDHEHVKDWVLAVSMDQKAVRELALDERGVYEACLVNPKTGSKSIPCVVTGNVHASTWLTFSLTSHPEILARSVGIFCRKKERLCFVLSHPKCTFPWRLSFLGIQVHVYLTCQVL